MRFLLLLCLSLVNGVCAAWDVRDSWADVVLLQLKARKPLPTITALEQTMNLEDAYTIQRRVVRELAMKVPIAGFRLDLTSPLARVRLRSDGPMAAAVLKDQVAGNGAYLARSPRSQLQLAPALGYVLAKRPGEAVSSAEAARALVAEVKPVVIVVDYAFEDSAPPRVQDLVAANGAPSRLVVGTPFSRGALAHLDEIFVELRRNDAIIDRGKASNAMGAQLEALRWLINDRLARGFELAPGALLVTGPLSEPIPAEAGDYLADFWEHGKLIFSVD